MWLLWAVLDIADPRGAAADQETLSRLAAGDADALASLYDRYARPVYSLAYRVLSDPGEAEDLVQEVFAQVWRQAARYDARRGAVASWLMTITRTRAIDRIRARRARPDGVPVEPGRAEQMPDAGHPQEQVVIATEQVARLRAALPQLPLVQRLAIELAFFEGLSHNEIAERLEQPLGTVKTRIRLGLLKLREAMNP